MGVFITGTMQRLVVHDKKDCKGDCPIHNPSDHHMKDWVLHWRDDKYIFERICKHGVGHPDPDSLAFLIKQYKKQGMDCSYIDTHGCCGCCVEGKQHS